MSLRKVKPGEPFVAHAATWNAFIDAAQDYQNRTADISRQPTAGFRSSGIVTVKNESGGARKQFEILGLGEPIFLPSGAAAEQQFKNVVTFRGVMPAEDEHEGKFAILLEPLAANAIGKGCISGVCQVRVNVTDEDHGFAEIADGKADVLDSGDTGSAKILWKESGKGKKWAVVHLGAQASVVAIYARITAAGGDGGVYTSWREVELTNGTWATKQGGLAGPGDGKLREINAAKNVPTNTIVHAFKNPGEADPVEWLFQFTAATAIFGRITSSSPVAGTGNNKFIYQFAQVAKTQAGYGGWSDVGGGIAGDAFNLIEDQNTGYGTLGNGVKVEHLDTDTAEFKLQPVPTGTRLQLFPVTRGNETEWWFSYENGVTGECKT